MPWPGDAVSSQVLKYAGPKTHHRDSQWQKDGGSKDKRQPEKHDAGPFTAEQIDRIKQNRERAYERRSNRAAALANPRAVPMTEEEFQRKKSRGLLSEPNIAAKLATSPHSAIRG